MNKLTDTASENDIQEEILHNEKLVAVNMKLRIEFDTAKDADAFIKNLAAFLVANNITMPEGITPHIKINGETWGWHDAPAKP